MNAQKSSARLAIIDRDTGQVVAECQGAGPMGVCPQVPDGGLVPCAGRRIVPSTGSELQGWTIDVYTDAADGCPLAVLPMRDVPQS